MSASCSTARTVVTMDAQRTEHAVGHVVVRDGRVAEVGRGPGT